MPDQEAKPPAHPEQNSATGSPAPGGERPYWRSENRLENLANILTVIVALAAIGLAVWQGYQNRQFFRLSVLPHLEKVPMSVEGDSGYRVRYFVRSTGLGPAVLQNFLVFHEGEKVYDSEQADSPYYYVEVREDLHQLPFQFSISNWPYVSGQILRAGGDYTLMDARFTKSSVNEDSLDRWPPNIVMDDVLNTRSFVFCYCSVYETDCDMTYMGAAPPVENVCGF